MCWAPCGCLITLVGMSGIIPSLLGPATLEDVLDIGRHDPGGGAIDMFLEQRLVVGWFEVDLDGMSVCAAAHLQHEAIRAIDFAPRADAPQQAAAFQSGVDLVHMHGHVA